MAEEKDKTTAAQRRASRAWEERNREKNRFDVARRQARRYVRDFAKEKDLKELEEFIAEKRKVLKEES